MGVEYRREYYTTLCCMGGNGHRVLFVCLVLVFPALPTWAGLADADCLQCHSDKTLTKTNAAGKEISLFVDSARLAASVHKTNSCASCHADLKPEHPDDNLAARPVDCRRCHEQAAADYTVSSHGRAFASGVREAPTCNDCHSGEHSIQSLNHGSSSKLSAEICSRCHASERINTRYQMPADRVKTFFESYHGLVSQSGSTVAANCASCHGYHKILPSSDVNSTIHPAHLVETCGKCHPGASQNFAASKIHVDNAAAKSGPDLGNQVNWWVRRIYLALIFTVVGALALHNLLAWLHSAMAARRARGATVQRMSRGHRIQHFILLSSFVLLALTGFALKYPDTWPAWMFANEDVRRWLHRGAGVVLIGLGCYHLFYIFVSHEGRRLVKDFWPHWQDLRDIITNVCYLTGRSRERAKFGRFGYPEKLEYWAVAWGIIIMGVTGLMIWFKLQVTEFVPRWVVDVAVTVHYYEAILACLAIVVWHFYHVIFAPDVYPMNWSWWDGKVSQRWQEEEHPLEQLPETKAKSPVDYEDI